MQNVNASDSAKYMTETAIDDLEVLLTSETEEELNADNTVVHNYTYEKASSDEHQVAEFVTSAVNSVKETSVIIMPTMVQIFILTFAISTGCTVIITDRLGRSLFLLPTQVFGPRTAKSQPIWIKFYTHLLLYRIRL